MKRFLCLVLSLLLPFSIVGCAANAPDFLESFYDSQSSDGNPAKNYYSINGVMQDVGDYTEIEKSFLSDYLNNILPSTNISSERVFVYDMSEITDEVIEKRRGNLIIERCIGIVTDEESGDGQVLNGADARYYISYRGGTCEDLSLHDGTVVISYLVFNPYNNSIDDIMERYDFVLCREYEN